MKQISLNMKIFRHFELLFRLFEETNIRFKTKKINENKKMKKYNP